MIEGFVLIGFWLVGIFWGYSLYSILQSRRRRIHGEDELRMIYREWTELEHLDHPIAEGILDLCYVEFWGDERVMWTTRFHEFHDGLVIVVEVQSTLPGSVYRGRGRHTEDLVDGIPSPATVDRLQEPVNREDPDGKPTRAAGVA